MTPLAVAIIVLAALSFLASAFFADRAVNSLASDRSSNGLMAAVSLFVTIACLVGLALAYRVAPA